MKRYFFVFSIIFVIGLFQSCGTNQELVREKCDIALLNGLMQTQENEIIKFTIGCESKITDQQVEVIKKIGIKVNSVIDKFANVAGDKQQIIKLSNLDFIVRMEGAQKVKVNRKIN